MARYLLALDQGTTSSRSIIFSDEGKVVAMAQKEFSQYFPKPGWVEHDAEEIWASQRETIKEALSAAKLTAKDIQAIGIANQRETTILWDRKTGKPVAPAIVWQDRRTSDLCASLKASGVESAVSASTGLLLDPYFSGTKLAWLLSNIEHGKERAKRGELCFGTVDAWLIWKLTQGEFHVTDRTNASRTLMMNLECSDWDHSLLSIFDIHPSCLPKIINSSGSPELLARLDDQHIPIYGIAGDQQAALFGQCCHRPGMAKNTYGTGCFLLMHTGESIRSSNHRLLTTSACSVGPAQFALEGSVFMGGAVIQWLRDGLKLIDSSNEVEVLARSVPDNGGVYLVPAFTGLGSPHWDPLATGTLIGLTRGSHRGHLARAALESIAFQSAELMACMAADAGQSPSELRVDGGAARNDLLMQCQSDLIGVPIVRPKMTETTALGAAYLAGLGAGIWESTEQLSALWEIDKVFEPTISRDESAERMSIWSKAVERSKNWH